MFCPKCASQNLEGASYCRVCGANISLIPQALSGQLPRTPEPENPRSRRGRRRETNIEPSFEKGIFNVFVGLGFIVAGLAIMLKFPGGVFWGWCFFIPGFSNLGRGVAAMAAARRIEAQNSVMPGNAGAFFPNQPGNTAPPLLSRAGSPQTGELRTPVPSVTEGTTRHLGAEAPTRHLEE